MGVSGILDSNKALLVWLQRRSGSKFMEPGSAWLAEAFTASRLLGQEMRLGRTKVQRGLGCCSQRPGDMLQKCHVQSSARALELKWGLLLSCRMRWGPNFSSINSTQQPRRAPLSFPHGKDPKVSLARCFMPQAFSLGARGSAWHSVLGQYHNTPMAFKEWWKRHCMEQGPEGRRDVISLFWGTGITKNRDGWFKFNLRPKQTVFCVSAEDSSKAARQGWEKALTPMSVTWCTQRQESDKTIPSFN